MDLPRPLATAAGWLLILVASCGIGGGAVGQETPVPTVLVDRVHLDAAARRYAEQPDHPVFARLIDEADRLLEAPLQTVTDKTQLPPDADPHDYRSVGVYWWPDPETADGLPWIRRDGRVNPAVYDGANSDSGRLNRMVRQGRRLGLAYHVSGEPRYADRAAEALRTWFLDPATAMNPNLRYAQGVPGRSDGRRYGIIEFHPAIALLDAVKLLAGSGAWSDEDDRALRRWFAKLVQWLQTSEMGLEARATPNNHAAWRMAQEFAYRAYADPPGPSAFELQQTLHRLLQLQVDDEGRQPHELTRTRSLSYSYFNLEAFQTIARLAQLRGEAPWQDEPRLRAAEDFVRPYALELGDWPHEQIEPAGQAGRRALWTSALAPPPDQRSAYADPARQLLQRDEDSITLQDLAALGAGLLDPPTPMPEQ